MRRFKLEVNTRIDIEFNDIRYKTIIQDVVNDGFLISIPVAKGEYLTLKDGETVILDYYCDEQNLYRITCKVINKVEEGKLHLYKISLPDEIKKIQRRNYVRVNVLKQIQYCIVDKKNKTTALYPAMLLDLSGGGVRIKVKETLHFGDKVLLNINIDELKIKVYGEVVRIEKAEDKRNLYGIRFDELNTAETETIIKSVFTIMRKQRELV